MALTIANECRKAALDAILALLNGGSFRLLTSASAEIASLPLSATAFGAATTASPSVATSNAITADTSITANSTIGRFALRTSGAVDRIAGTVGTSGADLNVTSATVPSDATEIRCTGGLQVSLQLS